MANKNLKPPYQLNAEEVKYLINIKSEDYTMEKLKELLAFTKNRKPKYNTNSTFILKKGLCYNDKDIKTNVGRYIVNKFLLDDTIGNIVGYINKPFNGGTIGDFQGKLSDLLLNDKITNKDIDRYIDKLQWLGFGISSFVSTSLTTDMMVAPEKVKRKKEELLAKYEKQLETSGSELEAISIIEAELIKLSKEELEGIADLDIYESGSRGSFENNFKLTALIRGANKNFANPSEIRIAKSSLADGIDPKELYMFGDIMVAGSAGRALGTAEGGYQAKKLMSAFQTTVLDKDGSDCRTKHYLTIKLDKDNAKQLTNRFFKDPNSNNLIELTNENKDKYIGKLLKFRSPMYCANENTCSKCAGTLPYKLGIQNMGLLINQVAQAIVTSSMKSFHDMTIRTSEINIDDYLE